MQRWVYDQGWTSLRDAQERAIEPLLAGDRDVVIAAATAAGKTEAAFLPICSALATAKEAPLSLAPEGRPAQAPEAEPEEPRGGGVEVLYLSPLKALINDQYGRLDELCERLGVSVTRWHGDVSSGVKKKALEAPEGVLLITPESLEALFVKRGSQIARLLGRLRYVVIDELHSFIGSPRGAQLQSLLTRVEVAIRRRPPRVGLSATLGDMAAATSFLRPIDPEGPLVISSAAEQALRLQVRGYRSIAPEPPGGSEEPDEASDEKAIADHLFRHLRGSDNLIFANTRRAVEQYAYMLAQRSERERVPNEFWPHHGSLDRSAREALEKDLKDSSRPASAVCTSTLELGIDIGTVSSVAQVRTPPSVAAMRQRLGRSGRRGEAGILRIYISEPEIDARSSPIDELRCDLVQSVAMVELLLERWLERPAAAGLNLSTLVQQTLSLIAQHGGVSPSDAHHVLCGPGPFQDVDGRTYARLLRALSEAELVVQADDGTLFHGTVGERFVNHYAFYAAFESADEWRLVAEGRTLGTMPVFSAIEVDAFLLFSGRRWRIVSVEAASKVIGLVPAAGGAPPTFGGGGPAVSDGVRAKMVTLYECEEVPAYLDSTACQLLSEGRAAWRRLDLSRIAVHGVGSDTLLLPWVGDPTLSTVELALRRSGLDAGVEGPAILVHGESPEVVVEHLIELISAPAPDGVALADAVENRAVDKWDWALSPELSREAYAARFIHPDRAWAALRDLATSVTGTSRPPKSESGVRWRASRGTEKASADPEFCVVDVETTGFSPRLGDRVLELAAVRVRSDGELIDEWTTLVNPLRDVGPTRIHGITAGEVLEAPAFGEIAGDLLDRIDGAVVVAHNLRFDWSFLVDEYERLGAALPAFPGVCTLALGSRVHSGMPKRRLAACCASFGVALPSAHTALSDARATAGLLKAYTDIAWRSGDRSLARLGCEPLSWPAAVPEIPRTGKRLARAPGQRLERQGGYLADLVGGLEGGSDDADLAAYLEVLDRALEDRRLSSEEASELAATAAAWGLNTGRIRSAHRDYFRELVGVAMRDGVLSPSEREDLDDVRALLRLDPSELDTAFNERGPQAPDAVAHAPMEDASLRGRSVCFTGQLGSTFDGAPITRAKAEQLAEEAGLEVHDRVTKSLDLLVVADPDTQSGKARQARANGTRVIAEPVFWADIGVDLG